MQCVGGCGLGLLEGSSISFDLFPSGTKSITVNPTDHFSLSTAGRKVPTGWVQEKQPNLLGPDNFSIRNPNCPQDRYISASPQEWVFHLQGKVFSYPELPMLAQVWPGNSGMIHYKVCCNATLNRLRWSMAALSHSGRVEYLRQRLYDPQNLEYLLSGHLQKFVDSWSRGLVLKMWSPDHHISITGGKMQITGPLNLRTQTLGWGQQSVL